MATLTPPTHTQYLRRPTPHSNATTVFSFWPEVKNASSQHAAFSAAGCLSNSDLGGSVLDTTITSCRDLIWSTLLKPNYYSAGVSAYWLDETDGEGTGGGDGTHGYDTSFGPAAAFSQLWVNTWLSTFSRPVALLGEVPPRVLARGLWAVQQPRPVWDPNMPISAKASIATVAIVAAGGYLIWKAMS